MDSLGYANTSPLPTETDNVRFLFGTVDPLDMNNPFSSDSSTITLVIQDAKPQTLRKILDTLYRDGTKFRVDVQQ